LIVYLLQNYEAMTEFQERASDRLIENLAS
jgi:hypothetical protein